MDFELFLVHGVAGLTVGRHVNPIHDRQAVQRVKRIRARAAKHGIDGV